MEEFEYLVVLRDEKHGPARPAQIDEIAQCFLLLLRAG